MLPYFVYLSTQRKKQVGTSEGIKSSGFCWLNDLSWNIFHDKSPEDAGRVSDNKIFSVYLHSIHGPRLFQTIGRCCLYLYFAHLAP